MLLGLRDLKDLLVLLARQVHKDNKVHLALLVYRDQPGLLVRKDQQGQWVLLGCKALRAVQGLKVLPESLVRQVHRGPLEVLALRDCKEVQV